MKPPTIIVIINKKPYTLNANDGESMRSIPSAVRQQLITLLEAIKREERAVTTSVDASNMSAHQEMRAENQESRDADAVMAKLIMEEKLNQKPVLTKESIHKWMGIIALIVFLLVLIL